MMIPYKCTLRCELVAQVYKARLDGVSDVAVKFINHSEDPNKDPTEKFHAEVAILRACRNQAIVNFLGAWSHEVRICAL